jgi:hypothetical protein
MDCSIIRRPAPGCNYIPGSVDTVNGPEYTSSYNFQTVTNAFFNHPEKEFLNNSRNMSLSAKFDF